MVFNSDNIDFCPSRFSQLISQTALIQLYSRSQQFAGRILNPPPDSRIVTKGLHENGVNELLKVFEDKDGKTDYYLILDLDGTIWRKFDNLMISDFIQDPRYFPEETFTRLKEINSKPNSRIKPLFLTARAQEDIDWLNTRTNTMHGLDCYCDFGYSLYKVNEFQRERTYRAHALTRPQIIAGDYWEAKLKNLFFVLSMYFRDEVHFVGGENCMYMRFSEKGIKNKEEWIQRVQDAYKANNEEAKNLAIERGLITEDEEIFDLGEPIESQDGYLVIFQNKIFDEGFGHKKDFGIDFILENEGINTNNPPPNKKFIFIGDTNTDLVAMKRLKQKLPHQ